MMSKFLLKFKALFTLNVVNKIRLTDKLISESFVTLNLPSSYT